jgi:NAD(P)H dehydrogenase (quinone)
MPKIAIVFFSAQGHTRQLAHAVAEGARSVAGTQVEVCEIVGADIVEGRWGNASIVDACNAADAIVFGTPTYMGDTSAQMKAFIDACGAIWMKQGWKNKLAAAFTHSLGLSGDKVNTLQSLFHNATQHSMIWVSLGEMVEGTGPEHVNRLSSYSGAMAQSDWGQESCNPGDLKTAQKLGARVADVASRVNLR